MPSGLKIYMTYSLQVKGLYTAFFNKFISTKILK